MWTTTGMHMTNAPLKPSRKHPRKLAAGLLALLIAGLVWYVRANPRIFNESFLGHAHCITQASGALHLYANDHGGKFPVHNNGYGDALLLLAPDHLTSFELITGPCFSGAVFQKAKLSGANVNEAECGRVYVQGLTEGVAHEIVLLFDKLPTPGDHCHFISRFTRTFGREVLFMDGGHQFITTNAWPAFAEKQIKLLVEAGIPEKIAKSYYTDLPD